jgi:FSR family fosmidomycin resistance protein-like MFS transporter
MKNSKGFQGGKVMLVSFGHLVHDVYTSFLSPLLPLLIEKFSLTYSLASLLGIMQRLPNVINPFLGILADRMAMRFMVIITPAVTAVAMSLIGAAPSYSVIAILLLVTGISSAFFHVPTPVMITRVSGDQVGKGMSFYMFGGEIARMLGPLLILGAVTLWGLEGSWKVMPLGIAASVLLYFRLRKVKISEDMRDAGKVSGLKKTFLDNLPLFILLVGITFFRSIMRAALTTFLPTYMSLKGESLWTGGLFLSILEISGAAGTLFWGIYSDKIGRRNALLAILFTAPAFMYVFSLLDGWWAVPMIVLLGFFLLGTTPILLALVQDRAVEGRMSFLNGMFLTISFGSEAVSLMIVGAMSDWIGLVETFRYSSYIAIGAIPFVLMLKQGEKA